MVPVVRARGVEKRYGRLPVLRGVDLDVVRGEVTAIIGPNASGKTTFNKILLGLVRADRGEVLVDGQPVGDDPRYRARIGYMPQAARFPENLCADDVFRMLADLRGAQAARDEELIESFGLGAVMRTPIRVLSGGMRQRVNAALAFYFRPDLLLLDEPTAGLDPRVAYGVRQLVRSHKGRCTLVISSHNLHELEEICDYAAVLDHGRLVAHGSMQELTAQSEEIHVEIAAGPPVPLDALRSIPVVRTVSFDEQRRDLSVDFSREMADAETVIGHVLMCLLQHGVRISGVSKGRGLEQRVMELTAGAA